MLYICKCILFKTFYFIFYSTLTLEACDLKRENELTTV